MAAAVLDPGAVDPGVLDPVAFDPAAPDLAACAAVIAPGLCAAAIAGAFAALAGLAPAGTAPVRLDLAAPDGLVVLLLEVLPEVPSAVDRFWLMSISCSRLFTCTSWLMYSLGSVSAVGSWFCISVTNKVRKSLAEMVAEELPELPVLLVPAVCAAIGLALFPERAWLPVNEFPAANDCPAANW
jgi:hypothetical protein